MPALPTGTVTFLSRIDVTEGLPLLRQGLAAFRTLPDYRQFSGVLRQLLPHWAMMELDQGLLERAVTMLSGTKQLTGRRQHNHEQAFFDETLSSIRKVLDPEAFQRAWRRGESMTIDELIDFCVSSDK